MGLFNDALRNQNPGFGDTVVGRFDVVNKERGVEDILPETAARHEDKELLKKEDRKTL